MNRDGEGGRTWRRAHPAMGTVVSLAVHASDDREPEVRKGLDAACRHLDRMEEIFTTWQPDSPMCRYREGRRLDDADATLIEAVLERCRALRDVSHGWFDPWSLPGGLDPSGYVKGWAAGAACDLLAASAPLGCSVGAGGDWAVTGHPPEQDHWRIAIAHPWRADALAGVVRVTAAVATSGNYARVGQLWDPFTGRLAETVPSATVVGDDPGTVDAWATAMAVGGSDVADLLDSQPGLDYHLIGSTGEERSSSGLVFVPPDS